MTVKKNGTENKDLTAFLKQAKEADFDKRKLEQAKQTIAKFGHPDFDKHKPAKALKAEQNEKFVLPFKNGNGVSYVVEVEGNEGKYAARVIKREAKQRNKNTILKKGLAENKSTTAKKKTITALRAGRKKKSVEKFFRFIKLLSEIYKKSTLNIQKFQKHYVEVIRKN